MWKRSRFSVRRGQDRPSGRGGRRRPDVAERREETLKSVQALDTPGVHAVDEELDSSDAVDDLDLPGAIINEELVVHIVPPAADAFTCDSCFLSGTARKWSASRTA